MGTTVLGEPVSMPILIAPTALPGLTRPEGEIAAIKAAGAGKIPMTLATLSTSSIEEAMAVAAGLVWFRVYVFKDRAITASLVQRPEAAGRKAAMLTDVCARVFEEGVESRRVEGRGLCRIMWSFVQIMSPAAVSRP